MWSVMIADDEPLIREGLEKLIDWSSLGCELTFIAENGQQLLDEIRKRPPDIVIADIRMPLMTGLEVAQYIYEQHLDIEVIILTAYADFQYAHEAIRCQVSDYIVKTSALEDIPAAVEKIRGRLEEKRLASYRMLLITSGTEEDGMNPFSRFTRSAFEGYEYRSTKTSSGMACLIFTMRRQDTLEALVLACDKFGALCRSFLGISPQVLISPPYEDIHGEYSVFAGLQQYWKSHLDALADTTVCVADSNRNPDKPDILSTTPLEEEDLFCRTEAYIQDNFTKRLSLDEIAEAVHANRSYLSRLYKQRTGVNLFDAINDMRVERAKELIREGRRKIYEIAGLTGFDDTAYFSRVFKKYTGKSPKEYESAYRDHLPGRF